MISLQFTKAILAQFGVRRLSDVEYCIVHHSVANPTLDISNIDKMERKDQGFVSVGYHAYAKLIHPENDLWVCQMGRPIWAIPAAAYGLNLQSYDLCIGGNYQPGVEGVTTMEPSENALKAIAAQIHLAKAKCPNMKWLIGHRDVAKIKGLEGYRPFDYSTACPGDNLYDKLNSLRQLTGLKPYPGI